MGPRHHGMQNTDIPVCFAAESGSTWTLSYVRYGHAGGWLFMSISGLLSPGQSRLSIFGCNAVATAVSRGVKHGNNGRIHRHICHCMDGIQPHIRCGHVWARLLISGFRVQVPGRSPELTRNQWVRGSRIWLVTALYRRILRKRS
jgi:hypothetical protein